MAVSGDALEIIDKKFKELTIGIAPLEIHYEQCLWAEGPVWLADSNCLIWSDIPNNRMLQFVPGLGVTTFRAPSNFVNGNTRDLQGRLLSCSHGARAVLRTEHDGTVTTLVDSYQGKRLNSPNDVVVKSDGTVWFTDPTYGIISDYEGYKSEQEQAGCYVYRFDPADNSLSVVADDFAKPNGLAFSPDESLLYISDTGRSHDPDWPIQIRQFNVDGDRLSNSKVFADIDSGLADGFRLDVAGNVWTSAGLGVNVYDPAGTLLGRIHTGQKTANVEFGGPKRNRLFIASNQFLMSTHVNIQGAQRP